MILSQQGMVSMISKVCVMHLIYLIILENVMLSELLSRVVLHFYVTSTMLYSVFILYKLHLHLWIGTDYVHPCTGVDAPFPNSDLCQNMSPEDGSPIYIAGYGLGGVNPSFNIFLTVSLFFMYCIYSLRILTWDLFTNLYE